MRRFERSGPGKHGFIQTRSPVGARAAADVRHFLERMDDVALVSKENASRLLS